MDNLEEQGVQGLLDILGRQEVLWELVDIHPLQSPSSYSALYQLLRLCKEAFLHCCATAFS